MTKEASNKYLYGFSMDTGFGLGLAVHSWTETEVKLKSFGRDGDYYTGTLEFTFVDNFGLDAEDINGYNNTIYGMHAGKRSWYILQHYEGFEGLYKPFKTSVTVEYQFEGYFDGGR